MGKEFPIELINPYAKEGTSADIINNYVRGWVIRKFGKDAEGNVFTYWGNSFLDVEVDTTITVKATIKAHREYQGTKQTVINRPKLVEKVGC